MLARLSSKSISPTLSRGNSPVSIQQVQVQSHSVRPSYLLKKTSIPSMTVVFPLVSLDRVNHTLEDEQNQQQQKQQEQQEQEENEDKDFALVQFKYSSASVRYGWLHKRSLTASLKPTTLTRNNKKNKVFVTLEGQVCTVSTTCTQKSPDKVYSMGGAQVYGDQSKGLICICFIDGKLLKFVVPGCRDSKKAGKSSPVNRRRHSKSATAIRTNSGSASDSDSTSNSSYTKWMIAFKRAASSKFQDHYLLQQEIGKGAFGKVYRAIDKKTGDLVAVKVVEKRFTKLHELDCLMREHKIHTRLEHPRVIKTIDIFDTKAKLFFVMELIQHGTLDDLYKKKGRFSENQVKEILRSIAQGLIYLSQQGIVHRDLKLKNILVRKLIDTTATTDNNDHHRKSSFLHDEYDRADDRRGHQNRHHQPSPLQNHFQIDIALADFGLSNFNSELGLQSRVGSPYFCAPEVVLCSQKDNHYYDYAVDAWSADVIAYMLLTGKYPFTGKTVPETLKAVVKRDIDLASPAWEGISDHAKQFVEALLQKNPQKRMSIHSALEHPFLKD